MICAHCILKQHRKVRAEFRKSLCSSCSLLQKVEWCIQIALINFSVGNIHFMHTYSSNTSMKLVTLLLSWEQEAFLQGIVMCVERCYTISTCRIYSLVDWKQCVILFLPVILFENVWNWNVIFRFFTLGEWDYDQAVTNGRITVVLESGLMASSRQWQSLNELNLLLVEWYLSVEQV